MNKSLKNIVLEGFAWFITLILIILLLKFDLFDLPNSLLHLICISTPILVLELILQLIYKTKYSKIAKEQKELNNKYSNILTKNHICLNCGSKLMYQITKGSDNFYICPDCKDMVSINKKYYKEFNE